MADPQRSFHSATRAAQVWLAADEPARALEALRLALPHANRLSPAHRRLTMRAMNWTRAAARRAAPALR
jgi:hypothetical protein